MILVCLENNTLWNSHVHPNYLLTSKEEDWTWLLTHNATLSKKVLCFWVLWSWCTSEFTPDIQVCFNLHTSASIIGKRKNKQQQMDKQNHYKQVYSNCNLQNSATITSIGPTVGKQFSFLWLHAKTIKGTYTTCCRAILN